MSESIPAVSAAAAAAGSGVPAVATTPRTMPAPAPSGALAASPAGDLDAAVQALQHQVQAAGAELEFRIDRDLDRVIVTLRDARDGRVLRQIPAEEVLRIARMLREARAALIEATV
ncbi:flagellar protein FlaG [Sinimarinibacterium thermocellulolyticum]|uniref:Flagellar protein FlaG n=1 Tax=Sinimarinibacterium thermocellulolyticum TaxID=3170016 RepID=A0ABV2ACB0_9GAMM